MTRHNCHKNRYGEYVCRSCRKAGKHWTRRRVLWNAIWKRRHWAIYVCCAIAGTLVFYRVLAYVIASMQNSEP